VALFGPKSQQNAAALNELEAGAAENKGWWLAGFA